MDTHTHTHTHMILTAMTMRGVSLTPIDREDKLRLIEANDARTTEWTHQATMFFFLFFSFSFSNRPSQPSLSALMKVKSNNAAIINFINLNYRLQFVQGNN